MERSRDVLRSTVFVAILSVHFDKLFKVDFPVAIGVGLLHHGLDVFLTGFLQVWSLTQFYSVDFSQSGIGVKKCVFNNRTIKVCVNCDLDGVLGPPRLARHT